MTLGNMREQGVHLPLSATTAMMRNPHHHLPTHGHYNVDKPSLPGTFHVELSSRFSSLIEPSHWSAYFAERHRRTG
jgi:hypothetical protein